MCRHLHHTDNPTLPNIPSFPTRRLRRRRLDRNQGGSGRGLMRPPHRARPRPAALAGSGMRGSGDIIAHRGLRVPAPDGAFRGQIAHFAARGLGPGPGAPPRRHDRPGPRYTSYPTAPHFAEGFGEADFRDLAKRSNQDPIPRQLSLYAHIPYCQSPCFYCGCNRIITRDVARGRIYLDRLEREIALAAPLFDRDREVVQRTVGGGTPNSLAPELLGELVGSLGRHFSFSRAADRDFSIGLDPRFVTPDDIEMLSALGFNRTSLGVQDFDPEVQEAINRVQGIDETLAIIDACRRFGMRSVNVDLIYGLPKQTLAGFGRTLDT